MRDHNSAAPADPSGWRKDALALAAPLVPALILCAVAWGSVTAQLSAVKASVDSERIRTDQLESRLGKAETNEAVTAQALTDMKATLEKMDGKLDQAIGHKAR